MTVRQGRTTFSAPQSSPGARHGDDPKVLVRGHVEQRARDQALEERCPLSGDEVVEEDEDLRAARRARGGEHGGSHLGERIQYARGSDLAEEISSSRVLPEKMSEVENTMITMLHT